MKSFRRTRMIAGFLAVWNLIVPLSVVHAVEGVPRSNAPHSNASRSHQTQIRDIELGAQGQVIGQVTDVEGRLAIGQSVIAIQDGRHVGVAVTDEKGRFEIGRLHGGLFQVVAGPRVVVCRGWVKGTAPPVASRQLLLVTQGVVQRGQRPFRDLLLADPIMVGLVIAAAVAIPIAVGNSRSESPPGS